MTTFQQRSKGKQPFDRSRPYTEVTDRHAAYYAMHDAPPKGQKVGFKDDDGRRYRVGAVQPGGLRRLYVKLPKGVTWIGRTRTVTVYPMGQPLIRMTMYVVYASIANDMTSRQGFIDVRGWV